jgi:hypothetical protein
MDIYTGESLEEVLIKEKIFNEKYVSELFY